MSSVRSLGTTARRALAGVRHQAQSSSGTAPSPLSTSTSRLSSSCGGAQRQRRAGARCFSTSRPSSSLISSSPSLSNPSLRPSLGSSRPNLQRPGRQQARTIFIQTQDTPNQDALKFLPAGQRVLPAGFGAPFVEYLSPRSTLAAPHPSPLAAQLLAVDGVTAVFYGPDYITVTKATDVPWPHVKPEVFALITEAVTAGQPIVTTKEGGAAEGGAEGEQIYEDTLQHDDADDEVVQMIKELLDTRIRPAIQEDGGDIEYRGFKDGTVMLKLRGACRTCDSSTVTLKNGIENMLMHYIEEVKAVTQVLDEEEEVAMKEFAKFEEKLKQQKGEAAVAGTGGKGTLDAAEG